MYKLTLRVDDQLREYLQSIFRVTDLERNEILQAMMFFGSREEKFVEFVKSLSNSPLPSLEKGLGEWILAKRTQERIEGEGCRHATSLFRGESTGKTIEGNRVLSRTDQRPERETSRPTGKVYRRDSDRRKPSRIPNTNGKTGTIKISF